MAKERHQTSHVMLVYAGDRFEMLRVGEGFCWNPYPEEIVHNGRSWRYFYCREALPYYREVV